MQAQTEGDIMSDNTKKREETAARRLPSDSSEWNLSRRSLLSAGAILGFAAMTHPTEQALAWSSWTNATSPVLKNIGMGDCVHEDLVQISYARVVRKHANDGTQNKTLLNPWAGTLLDGSKSATIAGDTVDRGGGDTFADEADLAARLYRENLAYLRIGSFWNDAAANILLDFAVACYYANSVPKFSGNDYYTGAWDVGQHIAETYADKGYDALVQFTMNDRNNFIHGMLSSTASHSGHLRQSEVKTFALQWLGVAYEYARTGQVTATKQVTQEQAQKIFKGFIDTYGQLDNDAHDMCVSLKVSNSEASRKLPHRRLRLRALGMMCHTMEDFWCPAHTCRTYHEGGTIPKNSILAFSNYKLQNGTKPPFLGYHIPFDRYAGSDLKNSTDWRKALTRGDNGHAGTEKLANALNDNMSDLDTAGPFAKFNTLGMNETIDCITTLLEFLYTDTPWDDAVYNWVSNTVMPTYFKKDGQSYVCDAGRRGLHTPTYIISPIKAMKRAYRKAGLSSNYDQVLQAAKDYDAWQRGAHLFFSGIYNTTQSKFVVTQSGASIWDDVEGQTRLESLVNSLYTGYNSLDATARANLLAKVGCNGCHGMVGAIGRVEGMLHEFSIELTGDLRSNDGVMQELAAVKEFFESGLKSKGSSVSEQSSESNWLHVAEVAYADEDDESYITSDMAIEDVASYDDGSYLIAVRDMDSLATSVMSVPASTPGREKLEEGLANLTITYTLETEFEGDPDYDYIVTDIDYTGMEENVYLVTGTVKSISADSKSLVLDLNGLEDLTLAIRSGVTDIPAAGAYICARYAEAGSALEFVDYDELDDPGTLTKVTYPVATVCGTSVWLLTNPSASDAEDGYQNLMLVEYGSADVFTVPQEGNYATVYYHDEAYGDVTNVDEDSLVAASTAGGFTNVTAQADDDDMDDSVDTPGYEELGDDYGELNYGNDIIHIANVIGGTDHKYDPENPLVPNPSADPTVKPAPKATSTTAAKTGDALGGLGGVLSAAALAGTAFTAYSARRAANEKKKPLGR